MSFSEDVLLLALDDDTGQLRPMPAHAFTSALAGAMLFDLAFADRLDNDIHDVFLIENSSVIPRHIYLLHDMLVAQGGRLGLSEALAVAALCVPECLQHVYDHLVEIGVLTRTRRFSADRSDAYVKSDWSRVRALRQRVRGVVMSDDLPDSQDIVIVSLLSACGLESLLFSVDERASRRERMGQLVRMEVLGQKIFKAIETAQATSFEKTAAMLIDRTNGGSGSGAGGVSAVMSAMGHVRKALGMRRAAVAFRHINQPKGFDCPSCAWPDPEGDICSRFEFCENGAKALASDGARKTVDAAFFEQWSVADLANQSDHWLELQGRLAEPVIRRCGDTHYRPISYEEAYSVIKEEMTALESPDEAVFYAAGVAENESAFLFQLFARKFGTNNLPNSINLCHEPSGMGMARSLGYAKGDAVLEDFEWADAIFLFGHNPGSNHPRMLRSLQQAARRGARIVAINPLPESGLSAFANPKEIIGLLGHATPLADLHVPIHIGGDMAFIQGVIKCMVEAEEKTPGEVFDLDFIEQQTSGLEPLLDSVRHTEWEQIEALSGVDRALIERVATIYMEAESAIATWGLGITHHVNGTDTIQHIINMLLLRGNIGRRGCGVCPMRGHSNIIGIRSMGCGSSMPPVFLDSLKEQCGFVAPRKPGLDAVGAVRAMHDGQARVCLSLGGNLAASSPDTGYTATALGGTNLTVMMTTKLNRSHVTGGRTSVVLPCLGRSEIDEQSGVPQYVTVEDAMGYVHASQGCLYPVAPVRSKPRIVAELAEVVVGGTPDIRWLELADDYVGIRQLIEQVIPSYKGFVNRTDKARRFVIDNPIRRRDFSSLGGRARFTVPMLPDSADQGALFRLMSIRSHDQFNTTIYGLDDRYRGIRNQRRVVFMNCEDMNELKLNPEQGVTITSHYEGISRSAPAFYAIPYEIPRGCAAVYFPEANALVPHDRCDTQTGTPAYKSIPVTITG